MSKKTYLDDPCLGNLEKERVLSAIESGYVSTFGPFVAEFEQELAGFLDVKKVLAVQSGTAAIYLSLLELGIGPGDEVIVPALTFAGTVNPVLYVGATPVFVDVDPLTWNIDVSRLRDLVTDKTRAVICVHLYGNPCDMDFLQEFVRTYDLSLIEDATESLGATYAGKMTGTYGEAGCFSFNGNKLITTGGGGLIVLRESQRLEHLRYLINQAKAANGWEGFAEIGFNYRMTNLAAALGTAQMVRLPEFLVRKKEIFSLYEQVLGSLADVSLQKESPSAVSSRWFTCGALSRGKDVVSVQKALEQHGIPSRRLFQPLNQLKAYGKYVNGSFPVAEGLYQRGLCLPSSILNSSEEIDGVASVLRDIID